MRVMAYNILDGGIRPDPSRLGLVRQLLSLQSPDILAVQEANWFDEDGLLDRIGDELGLPHRELSRGALYEGVDHYHVVTLSKYPIRSAHTFPGGKFQSAILSTVIDTPIFGEISVCNVHFHAYSEDARLLELKQVMDFQNQYPDQVLLGDFNSISDIDTYNPETIPVEHRFDVTTQLRGRYVDVLGSRLPKNTNTYPSSIDVGKDLGGPIRIDYVHATSGLASKVKDAQVFKSSLAERASDHYPVIVDF